MNKLDLVKTDKNYYKARTTPEVRTYGSHNYLSISGQGAPGGDTFSAAVEALYPLAYGIKKVYKQGEMDFGVPKLEGLWWVDSELPALEVPREEWCWKLLIRMPDFVEQDQFENARELVSVKKKNELIKTIEFERFEEGKAIQVLHVGPYATEPETIAKMNRLMAEEGLTENGLHHEIYLSDPRRVAPEKMKTILRQPVK